MGMSMGRMMGRGGMSGMMSINGRSMNTDRIDVRVPLGSIEIWEIVNPTPLTGPAPLGPLPARRRANRAEAILIAVVWHWSALISSCVGD